MRRPLLALLVALVPSAAAAQTATTTFDIDGDGRPERFTLTPDGDTCNDLEIVDGTGATVRVRQVVCGADPYENGVTLKPTKAGSLQLTAEHYGIGRDKWSETLTLVSRNGAIRVGGYTFRWHDSLDPEAWGVCDLNLLTGRGTLATEAGTKAVKASSAAIPVTAWGDRPFPPECDPDGTRGGATARP